MPVRFFSIATLAAILLSSTSLRADEKVAAKKPASEPSVFQFPKEVELDAAQKESITALNAEFLPRIQALKQKMGGILTEDQKKALAAAKQTHTKDKAELAKALREAVQLTEEQKQQKSELKQQFVELDQEIQAKFLAVLTPKQKEIVQQTRAKEKVAGKTNSTVKKSVDKSTEKKLPGKLAQKKPVGKPTEKKPVDKSSEKKPAEKKPVGKPAEKKAVDKSSGKKPVDKSAEKKPAGKPSEKTPVDKPAEKKPVDKSAEKKPGGKSSAV